MKNKILILLTFISSIVSSQTTYYVDENDGSSLNLGTIDEPYTSFNSNFGGTKEFDNTTIYIARGNYITDVSTIWDGCDDFTIDAYGTGAKPILYNSDGSDAYLFAILDGSDITFQNLSLRGNPSDRLSNGVIYGNGNDGTEDLTFRNLDVSYGYNGFRLITNDNSSDYYNGTFTFDSVHVHHCSDDGMFLETNTYVHTDKMYHYFNKVWVHDVNLNWYSSPDANGGDCIHILNTNVTYVEMDSSRIDRASTGCKFGLMWRTLDNRFVMDSILITNTYFRPPADTLGHNCSALGNGAFLFTFVDDVTMINCWIDGREHEYCGTGWTGGAAGQIGNYNIADIQYTVFDSVKSIEGSSMAFTNSVVTGNTSNTIFSSTTIHNDNSRHYNNIFVNGSGTVFYNGNSIQGSNNLHYDTQSISTWDALFNWVDGEDSGDYHLTIDKNDGTDVGLLTDYDGVNVGDPPEIGAFEYIPGETLILFNGSYLKARGHLLKK